MAAAAITADCPGYQKPVQTWFSATLCLSLGFYAFIVYDQVVLPNRGIDNRAFPLPQLWQPEAINAPRL